jgi:hypothetical protein
MESQHVNVKLLVKNPEEVNLEALVPVFHGWIQNQGPGELLLDVADYRHVPSGPGVVLIGHQGNYSLDNSDRRLGVRYNRKAPLEGTNYDRLVQATQAALAACQRLEAEPSLAGNVRFNGREMEVFINDRLLAPNTPETRAATDSEFRNFFSTLFGAVEYTISYPQDSRSLFSLHVRTSQEFEITELLANLNTLTPASH